MDIYFEMAKHPVFTIEDVNLFYDNMNSARSAVKRMLAASKVQKIRNNLYTCISAENGSPVANRFQIASDSMMYMFPPRQNSGTSTLMDIHTIS